jgi:hypothetical protein
LRGYSKTSLQALLPCQWLKHPQVPITGKRQMQHIATLEVVRYYSLFLSLVGGS